MALALSTMICGAACAPDPEKIDPAAPKEERPLLPNPPADFGKPVPLPPRTKDVRAYAVRARETIGIANKRLENDGKFYSDVRKEFGR